MQTIEDKFHDFMRLRNWMQKDEGETDEEE
jgi:hypothetical protein